MIRLPAKGTVPQGHGEDARPARVHDPLREISGSCSQMALAQNPAESREKIRVVPSPS
jgi:hypothetical protein